MEQQPGSEQLREKLRPFLRDRSERTNMATRLGNTEEFKLVADQVEWAFATVRYAWDSESGRGPRNDQSQAVRLLVRAGFEIAESSWEAILDDRPPLMMALLRLLCEMSDKMIATSADPVAADLYLDDELSWKQASESVRKRFNDAQLQQATPDWFTVLRSTDPNTGWFHGPAHGGPVLVGPLLRSDGNRLYGEWAEYKSSSDYALQTASVVVRWCEVAVISIDKIALNGDNERRRARTEAATILSSLAGTIALAGSAALNTDRLT